MEGWDGVEEREIVSFPFRPLPVFSFVTAQNHNKVTRRRFNFTFFSKLTYNLTYILTII